MWTIAAVLVLALAGTGIGYGFLYRALYGPSAFVQQYLSLLATGRAADAMLVPGVAVDASTLTAAGLDPRASEALLRSTALNALTDIEIVGEQVVGGVTAVTATYRAGGYAGSSTFQVRSDGWSGLAPAWRFATTPLATIDLTALGTMEFAVNGFTMDKRQVSSSGAKADPTAMLPLLVFTPGLYAVTVDTDVSTASGLAVLADAPLTKVAVQVQADPTPAFVTAVQENITAQLQACADQQMLQPADCPFGRLIENRIASVPNWTIVTEPEVRLIPNGNDWQMQQSEGLARLSVDILSLYDGSVNPYQLDVPFVIGANVTVDADGTPQVEITATDAD